MKAVRIHSYGGRDKISVEDVPRPELHEGEVLVRVHDAGVNPVDWKIREGLLKELMPVEFPLTLGQDFAGVVEELGPGASKFKRGDEVFGFAHGSYAEFVGVNENAIALKPKNIDFATAASIPTAGLTAWQIVVDVAKVHEGQLVLIHGAAGGVGSFATQLAKWKGATLVANASQDDFPYLREIGVDDLIDYRTQKFEDRLFDVDVVIDLVGGAVLGRSYSVVKKNEGIVVSTVGAPDQNALDRRHARGERFLMKRNQNELSQLAELIEKKIVKPRIAQVLPLDEASRAQHMIERGHAHGKIVLSVQ
jgi:NADPH:quinone reductase-like Zn-dependent oxidoreductase